VTKGPQVTNFFTLHEFRSWQEATPNSHRWNVKYYKVSRLGTVLAPADERLQGLGTSKPEDGRAYFGRIGKHVIPFQPCTDEDKEAVDLAFSKKRVEDRKEWLRQLQVRELDAHE